MASNNRFLLALGLFAGLCIGSVSANAQTSVDNTAEISLGGGQIDLNPDNNIDNVVTPVTPEAGVGYSKSADVTEVDVGDTITYTVTVEVTDAPLSEDLVLTDTLGDGLEFVEVTDPGAFACNDMNPLECTLPAGTDPGTYTFTYTALVTEDADTEVSNAVVGNGGGGTPPICTDDCDITIPVNPDITYEKSAEPAEVEVGDTITYTVTTTVSNAPLSEDFTLTDTLGTGLEFDAVTDPGAYTCNNANPLVCTLPSGTEPGTYTLTYTATVTDAAGDTVANAVVGSGGGDGTPTCSDDCDIEVPVIDPVITYTKVADPASDVAVGDTITYTVTVDVTEASLSEDFTLTDTLGTGLDFGAFVAPTDPFVCSDAGNVLTCTLPEGTEPGSYDVSYTATVNADAVGSVDNAVVGNGGGGGQPICDPTGDCDIEVPLTDPTVTYNKTASPEEVEVGDTITYTVTTTISDAPLTDDLTLTDTLGTGLDFVAIVPPTDAEYQCVEGNPLNCTIPAGTGVGTYTLTYTAVVNDQAQGTVGNSVVAQGGGGGTPTCEDDCDIEVPVIDPVITYNKTADPSDVVAVGDTITYTVSVTVADATTTEDFELTDTLGTGLDFDAFDAPTDPFECSDAGNVLTCTLPAGTDPGTYDVSYTATVNADAVGSVGNAVVGNGGGGGQPTCETDCDIEVPLDEPLVTYNKEASPDTVEVGDTITYTVTTTISNAPITEDVVLTDTLGAGLEFVEVVDDDGGVYQCVQGNPLQCTIPAPQATGTYTLVYTAVVTEDAEGSVGNAVVAEGGGGAGPNCEVDCDITTPVIDPVITYEKSADPSDMVEVGDTITYTVDVLVSDASLSEDFTLTDTLGTGLEFVEFVEPTAPFTCSAAGSQLTCTLPDGTAPDSYSVSYTVTVTDEAEGNVGNSVVGNGGGGGQPTCSNDCDIEVPVIDPDIGYFKEADVTEVEVGDTVTYTVTVEVNDAALSEDLVLEDTLGSGLDFGEFVEPTDPFVCTAGTPLSCTLPAGTEPGTYTVSYTATVNDTAEGTVSNAVVGNGGGGGQPICTDDCDIELPVNDPVITYDKSVEPTENAAVGDTLTYTVSVEITEAALSETFTLTDTLGAGLDFVAFEEPTDPFVCGNTGNELTCDLPAGTEPGIYEVSYTATINEDAQGSVSNAVVGNGGGGGQPTCRIDCDIEVPLTDPVVTYEKTADPADEVAVGDTITYTVTTTISEAPITEDLVLTDTLGTGLEFGEIIQPTDAEYQCVEGNPLNCTIPAGTGVGTYTLTYTATVTEDADGNVANALVVEGGGGGNPACSDDCDIEIPVLPEVVYYKSTSTENAAVGDIITYTLTVEVSNGPLAEDLILTDTLGDGLTFIEVVDPGAFSCNNQNPLECTLPEGTEPGTYEVVYTAEVNEDAEGEVSNVVVGNGGGGTGGPECKPGEICDPTVPLVDPEVTYTKSSSTDGPVAVGDTIEYFITVEVADAPLTEDLVISDTLGDGLEFVEFTDTGDFTCVEGSPLECTLPQGSGPGSFTFSYTATVTGDASGEVSNAVVGNGGTPGGPICLLGEDCNVVIPVEDPEVVYSKSTDATEVAIGDTISYTLTVTVSNAALSEDLVLTDTLGDGLEFGEVTDTGNFTCNNQNPLECVLPAGTEPGTYEVTYTAVVTEDATDEVTNAVVGTGGGGTEPTCDPNGDCDIEVPLVDPTVTYAKSANQSLASVGDEVLYTLTVTVSDAPLTEDLTLTDTLGTGLEFQGVTDTGEFTCNNQNPLVCTLPAGTPPGTYELTYSAVITEDADTEVGNVVVGNGGSPTDPECETSDGCEVTIPLRPVVSYEKTANVEEVVVGDTITYTVTTYVENAPLNVDFRLTDTLGDGLTLVEVVDEGAYDCNNENPLVCILPAGTEPGEYSFSYTATVNGDALDQVDNVVVGSFPANPGGPGAPPPPGGGELCATDCDISIPVREPVITYDKSTSAEEVAIGDPVEFTLTTTIENAPLSDDLVLTDTLGTGLRFVRVVDEGAYTCNDQNPLICTLPAGTPPGTYEVTYLAQVTPDAVDAVENVVVGEGGRLPGTTPTVPPTGGPVCADGDCSTITPLADPVVVVNKSADPESGSEVAVGQQITYTLTVDVSNSSLTEDLVLTDTPDPGLIITEVPPECTLNEDNIVCVLPAGTPVGSYDISYTATVAPDAGDTVGNQVTASGGGGSGGPDCQTCETNHKVEPPEIRLIKTANVDEVQVGDLVTYTLTIENVGGRDLVDGTIVDTPPAGFSYVEGSAVIDDNDDMGEVTGSNPIIITGIDVNAGEFATVTYLMRVGAGVQPGVHTNEAVVNGPDGGPISNVATEDVTLAVDPLTEESAIIGRVYHDRDGDGWQDSATLSGVQVQGGFAPGSYIPGSTTMDSGAGPVPVPDASAPMLHGIAVGKVYGRQTEADLSQNHAVIIRQHLSNPQFTDDFVMTSSEGVTLTMDAAGNTRVIAEGDAARGLTAAQPRVERRVSRVSDGYLVEYIITNEGVNEIGIPGVRVVSVDGLVSITDQHGRYHMTGIYGGRWERGRNFILKVDPTTLPKGSRFTTDNPLVRRITPGLPVQFNWGVILPVIDLPRGSEQVEIEMGEVLFAPDSAHIQDRYHTVIEKVAATIRQHQGGEIVIRADGESDDLALARASAIKVALTQLLNGENLQALTISLRTHPEDASSLVAALSSRGLLLGESLFENGRAQIRSGHSALLDQVAEQIRVSGYGDVVIVPGADQQGSPPGTPELNRLRATAIYQALRQRLQPELHESIRVEIASTVASPVSATRH